MASTAVTAPDARPIEIAARRFSLYHWLATVDHKEIGILYLLTTLVFFVLGGIEALFMRVQLAVPNNAFLGPDAYNALFTMHGTTMVFLVVMPMLLGFANYIVPLQIGARDMAYPRLNALSFWLFFFGGILLYYGFLNGTPPQQGWFAYAPLTEKPFSLEPTIDYWIVGLLVSGAGSIATGVNLIVTVIRLRTPSMSALRIPVFTYMVFVTGLLLIWAIPALTASQFLLLADRYLGTHFFDVAGGGDALLWQNLFWYFGHPEVYIMALPAFGMISEVIPVFSRKPLFGYPVVVASGFAIAFLSFGVWAHHMFAVGLGFAADTVFGATSMLIAIPTGIKVFNWVATMWGGRVHFTTAMTFAFGFLAMFTIGGITGVQFATVPIDWQTTDTYYVVAHFHYVLFGGTYFAMNAAAYYWLPKITGRMLDERLGRWHFWLTFIGFNVTFFPMHILGLMGMARRVYTYPDLPGWGPLNLLETVGSFILAASVLVFLWNLWLSLRHGRLAGANPWRAWTLEWATTSPPPAYNFSVVPAVGSARPLWDRDHGIEPLAAPEPAPAAAAASWLMRLPMPVIGTITFITSEVIFFGALIATYIEYRFSPIPTGAAGPKSLEVGRELLFSLALFASSGTMIWSERQLHRGNYSQFRVWLVATILLGGIFLLGQATEFQGFFARNMVPSTDLWTGAFFVLTGFHGLHVLVGLLSLALLAGLAFKGGEFRERHQSAVDAVGLYWHFVDGVWVVIFSLVYLWSLF